LPLIEKPPPPPPPPQYVTSETVVIDDFYNKTGASVGAEQLLTQLATFTIATVNLCRLPVLFIE
jgi:hypothetical protein